MRRRIGLILTLAWIQNPSFANTCSLLAEGDLLAYELETEYRQIADEIITFTKEDLRSPSDIKITFLKDFEPTAFPFYQKIYMPLTRTYFKNNPEALKTTFAHEFGHLVFAENIHMFSRRLCSLSSTLCDYHLITSELLDTLRPRMAYEEAFNQGLLSPEAFGIALSKTDDLVEHLMKRLQKHERNPKIKETLNIVAPYNELFADTVAVLWKRDGKAISSIVGDHFDSSIARDFTIDRNLFTWSETDEHTLLSPTRSHLWKHYLTSENRSRVLRALLKAIGLELDLRITDSALRALTPTEVNQRLIRTIDEVFAKSEW